MDPSQFAGMSWDVWANHVETQQKEHVQPTDNDESKVNKLPKEDIKLFGVHVDMEPVKIVECELCGMIVKPQALYHHYTTKHEKDKSKDSDREGLASTLTQASEVSESTGKHFEKSEMKRSPLHEVCANKGPRKRRSSPVKFRTLAELMSEKDSCLSCEENVESPNENLGANVQVHKSRKVNLQTENGPADGNALSNKSFDDSIPSLSCYPKPLSPTPWFACHNVGGLTYPRRNMKSVRQNLQNLLEEKNNPKKLFPTKH